MASKTTRSKKPKQKQTPYISVDGVENRVLDAALLRVCSSGLDTSLSDELKILRKAGITVQELKKKIYDERELILKVSPHLLENYEYYKFLANIWDDLQHSLISNVIEEDYSSYTLEQWYEQILGLVDEDEMPVYIAINILRFYKNGQIKTLIPPLLENEDFVIKFYQETGIKIEGHDIDWDEIDVEEDEYEDMLEHDEQLNVYDALEIVEDPNFLNQKLLEHSPEFLLKIASNLILSVSDRVSNVEELEQYKRLYESAIGQVESLTGKVNELSQEVKSKNSQIQSLSKENRTLTKSVDTLSSQLENQQKEVGRLGALLGEARKEKEELEKENKTLERRVSTLEKEADFVAQKAEKELKKEYGKKFIKLQMKSDEKIADLETTINDLRKEYDKEEAKNVNLSAALDETMQRLDRTLRDLQVVEKERNELFELTERLKNATVKTPEKEQEEGITEDDEDMFDLDDYDIEDFIDFNNNPTKS